ncbi:TOMM precursor leader peptide-binding protein [Streptomyces sp. CA-294286]|uniref:TOMM precursor leader peptide-binding protein n=1 Tax=Streptomyces sp. CA-294286 TaxID=3240070 RepID=UPI003D8F9AC4
MEIVTLPTDTRLDAAVDAVRQDLAGDFAAYGLDLPGWRVEIGVLGLPGPGPREAAVPAEPDADTRFVLPVRMYRDTALVGPVVPRAPGARPCAGCLERRWIRLRAEREREALEGDGGCHVPGPGLPLLTVLGAPHLVAALARLSAEAEAEAGPGKGGPSCTGTPAVSTAAGDTTADGGPTVGGGSTAAATTADGVGRQADCTGTADVLEIDLRTGRTTRHPLLAEPDCPLCGPRRPDAPPQDSGFPAPRPALPPDASRLRHWRDHRLPKRALVNPVCGVLGALSPDSDRGAAVNANLNGAMRLGGSRTDGVHLYEVSWSGHAGSYAKSEALAFLEGLERYAGQQPRGRRRAEHTSLRALRRRGLPALDPATGLEHGAEFYARRAPGYVPFDPDLPASWVWGHSLRDGASVLVPEQLAYYGPGTPGRRFTTSSSNGCATGSCLEEAALHGLLELIERDAFLLTWYGAQPPRPLATGNCAGPETAALIDRLAGAGYGIHLFDMRVDLPVPAVLCLAKRHTPGPGDVVFSAAASLDPAEAVASAVGEAASLVEGFADRVTGAEQDILAMAADYDRVRTLHDHLMLYGHPTMADRTDFLFAEQREPRPLAEVFADWERVRPAPADLLAQLDFCARAVVDAAGGDLVVVDQSSPEQLPLGLRTVAVLAPGLLPIDFGWDQQRALHSLRLRTAAHRAGRRAAPLGEHEIHRHPHPFP